MNVNVWENECDRRMLRILICAPQFVWQRPKGLYLEINARTMISLASKLFITASSGSLCDSVFGARVPLTKTGAADRSDGHMWLIVYLYTHELTIYNVFQCEPTQTTREWNRASSDLGGKTRINQKCHHSISPRVIKIAWSANLFSTTTTSPFHRPYYYYVSTSISNISSIIIVNDNRNVDRCTPRTPLTVVIYSIAMSSAPSVSYHHMNRIIIPNPIKKTHFSFLFILISLTNSKTTSVFASKIASLLLLILFSWICLLAPMIYSPKMNVFANLNCKSLTSSTSIFLVEQEKIIS